MAGEKNKNYKIVINVDVNVNIFETMFNSNVNCTDYMHKKCCETNYSLCRDIYDML